MAWDKSDTLLKILYDSPSPSMNKILSYVLESLSM